MQYRFVIKGTLPNLNDLIAAERQQIRVKGKFTTCGNNLKQDNQDLVIWYLRSQLKGVHISKRIHIHYLFVEKNMKRDKDNVASFAMKIIQDSLVKAGVIDNDGWKNISGFSCDFDVDKNAPHIEVTLTEEE